VVRPPLKGLLPFRHKDGRASLKATTNRYLMTRVVSFRQAVQPHHPVLLLLLKPDRGELVGHLGGNIIIIIIIIIVSIIITTTTTAISSSLSSTIWLGGVRDLGMAVVQLMVSEA
jgi:hypothetical protein